MGRLVAEMDVWKLHQRGEMKRRGTGKPWEDECQRWIARGNAERITRTQREREKGTQYQDVC